MFNLFLHMTQRLSFFLHLHLAIITSKREDDHRKQSWIRPVSVWGFLKVWDLPPKGMFQRAHPTSVNYFITASQCQQSENFGRFWVILSFTQVESSENQDKVNMEMYKICWCTIKQSDCNQVFIHTEILYIFISELQWNNCINVHGP